MRGVLVAVVAMMALAVVASQDTLARFTDQQPVGSNSFTTSTISATTTPTSTLLTLSDMLPNASVTNSLVVTNAAGSAALRYAISATATNTDGKGLKDQLTLVIKTVDATTPGTPCDNFDGTQLYSGDLDSSAGKLVGDSAQGAQAGDRNLAVGASETLCFRVSLSSYTTNAHRGAATTVTFTVTAEQTGNNP
jgi:predicted ribosomally synthesized peptide with SipW-like signal peptide